MIRVIRTIISGCFFLVGVVLLNASAFVAPKDMTALWLKALFDVDEATGK